MGASEADNQCCILSGTGNDNVDHVKTTIAPLHVGMNGLRGIVMRVGEGI